MQLAKAEKKLIRQNLNLGTPLSQGGSHAVMPSLGHGTGLPYREGETPARAPINNEPLKPRTSNVYVWGLGENRGVHEWRVQGCFGVKQKTQGLIKLILHL